MPKRLCPFGDEFLPQIKTFVTEKKFNCGQINRMNAVHEKTKQLLFSGARLYFEKVKSRCCVCSEHSPPNKCTYCDKLVCKECEQCCYQCDLIFCKNCTFTTFIDKLDDGILCYSCFT